MIYENTKQGQIVTVKRMNHDKYGRAVEPYLAVKIGQSDWVEVDNIFRLVDSHNQERRQG